MQLRKKGLERGVLLIVILFFLCAASARAQNTPAERNTPGGQSTQEDEGQGARGQGTRGEEGFSRFALYGGYSILPTGLDADDQLFDEAGRSVRGFHTQFVTNLNRNFSVAADLSGHYENITPRVDVPGFVQIGEVQGSLYNFLVGPQYKGRTRRITPFAEALVGASRARVSGSVGALGLGSTSLSVSETKFAFALGGGLVVSINDRFAMRPIHADYIQTRFGSDRQHLLRLSFGVVVK